MVQNLLNGEIPALEAENVVGPRQNGYAVRQPGSFETTLISHAHNVRILSQSVNIFDFSYSDKSFRVHTDMAVVPLYNSINEVYVNLGRCAKLPNEADFNGQVLINDTPAMYERREQNPYSTSASGSIIEANSTAYNQLTSHEGELRIMIPPNIIQRVRAGRTFRISIDVLVENPKFGVTFNVCPGERGSHALTYRSTPVSGSREWLPCLDSVDQPCIWRLTFECDKSDMAIVSGELISVAFTQNEQKKLYSYKQMIPTAAPNMGWVVGDFVPRHMQELSEGLVPMEATAFAPPGLHRAAVHTTSHVPRMMGFLEETLNCPYPYAHFKIVFVDKASESVYSFATLTIMSVYSLYHKKIIDVAQETRALIMLGLVSQFFGCFLAPASYLESWCVRGIAHNLVSLYTEKTFGHTEAMYWIHQTLNQVADYENQWGPIILRENKARARRHNIHVDPRHPYTTSVEYYNMLVKKGQLVQRMLQKKLGTEQYMQVLNKMLSTGIEVAEKRFSPRSWIQLLVTTEGFFNLISKVTGHEFPSFIDFWIVEGGHPHFEINFSFNRRRNLIEVTVKQDYVNGNGRCAYRGPMTIWVQELDGAFSHVINIDKDHSTHELPCHSKGRRQKKKRCVLACMEEVEIDLTNADPESPILWLRIDPDLLLIRSLTIRQLCYHWEFVLKYERDVIAQIQALNRLELVSSAQSRQILIDIINSDNLYYRVRCRAAYALTRIMNKTSETWVSIPTDLIEIFKERYGCKSNPSIPAQNNFVLTSNTLQQYFLMQILNFILALIKFNDNSINRYSDDHYRASLLYALGSCVTAHDVLEPDSPSMMLKESRELLEIFSCFLNTDNFSPSYNAVIGVAALCGLYQMERNRHIPVVSSFFWEFAQPGLATPLRKGALWVLVKRLSTVKYAAKADDFTKLLHFCQDDDDPFLRRYTAKMLVQHPPFADKAVEPSNPLTSREITEQIWSEPIIRSYFTDLYYTLYGSQRPQISVSSSNPAVERPKPYRIVPAVLRSTPTEGWTVMDECPPSPGCLDYQDSTPTSADDLLE